MSIFVSHSSKNSRLAKRIFRCIQVIGYNKVFLDIDPKEGLTTGRYFAQELAEKHRESDTFVFIVTTDWLASSWCLAEHKAAVLRGCHIICIVAEGIEVADLPSEISAAQFISWTSAPILSELRSSLNSNTASSGGRSKQRSSLNQKSELSVFHDRAEAVLADKDYSLANVLAQTDSAISFIAHKSDFGVVTSKVAVLCWPDVHDAFEYDLFLDLSKEVFDYSNSYGAQNILIICSEQIALDAKLLAESPVPISILTINDMEKDVINYPSYLTGCISNYKSFRNETFIDLDGYKTDPQFSKTDPIHEISDDITHEIESNSKSFFFVLGDFGSGKTTVSENIHQSIAQKFSAGGTDVFPIMLYLRTLSQFENEEKFLQSQIRDAHAETHPDFFEKMVARGPVLLILDGFDEVASNSTYSERLGYFRKILKIAQSSTHLVLTSRPSVFTNFEEINELIGNIVDSETENAQGYVQKSRRADKEYENRIAKLSKLVASRYEQQALKKFTAEETAFYQIRPLSKEKIIDFFEPYRSAIRRKHKKTPEEVYEILQDIYDLSDIVTRPLLLDMFVQVLLKKIVDLDDPTLKIGPNSLYISYIEMHLQREKERTQYLSVSERREFSRAVAKAMLMAGGALEATFESIATIVRNTEQGAAPSAVRLAERDFEKVVTDVRVCGFLRITEDGKITFSHKSFMEFFVADIIHEKIATNRYAEELDKELNYEILQFVGGFGIARQDFRLSLFQHKNQSGLSPLYRNNLQLALIYSDTHLKKHSFSSVSVEGAKIKRQNFSNCKFHNVNFIRCELWRVTFDQCLFETSEFLGDVVDLSFRSCSGRVDIGPSATELSVRESNELLFGRLDKINTAEIRSSVLGIQSEGIVEIEHATILNSTISLNRNGGVSLRECKVRNSVFRYFDDRLMRPEASKVFHQRPMLNTDNCDLEDCAIVGWVMDEKQYDNAKESLRKYIGLVAIDDPLEQNSIFTQASESLSSTGDRSRVRRRKEIVKIGSLIIATGKWLRSHQTEVYALADILEDRAQTGEGMRSSIDTWFSDVSDTKSD